MTKHKILFSTVIILTCLLNACKKDVNTTGVRLNAFTYFNGVTTRTTALQYDNSGRISKITFKDGDGPVTTLFDVSYRGDEIIMSNTSSNDTVTTSNSISIFVDASNLARKKIRYDYLEVKPFPGVPEQRMFLRDTTLYEYDVSGLLQKETYHEYDSSWAKAYGRITWEVWLNNAVTSYVNSNGNMKGYNRIADEASYLYQNGSTSVTKSSYTEDWTFTYSGNYPNKTDFSNAVVLTQVCAWVINPMNKNYRNLPDQYTWTRTAKDENGAITRNSFSGAYTLKYNSYGFLASSGDQTMTNYIYNK
jgi:hypothetical protein